MRQPDDIQARKAELIAAMKAAFGTDQRRIDHALAVLTHAEAILTQDQADALTVYAAAILHDIGIQAAERKHGSAAGKYQEIEGPPLARAIMQRLRMAPATINHVCRIVGSHHSADDIDTPEFRIIWDADCIVNALDEHGHDQQRLNDIVERIMKTPTGRERARQVFFRKT